MSLRKRDAPVHMLLDCWKFLVYTGVQNMKHTITSFTFNSLFSRILISFSVLMLLPVITLLVIVLTFGNNTLMNMIQQQNELNTAIAAERMSTLITLYRHTAYAISNDEIIHDVLTGTQTINSPVFNKLFSIMEGETYRSSASVVSRDGKIRLSTHLFPDQYDVRYHTNDSTPFFEVNRLKESNASIISTEYRYLTQQNSLVLLNIMRAVRDSAGNIVGYVALDINQTAFEPIGNDLGFSDLLLIDNASYRVSSLVHVDKNGDFSLFPSLESAKLPLGRSTMISGSSVISFEPIKSTSLVIAGVVDTKWYQYAMGNLVQVIAVVMLISTLIATLFSLRISKGIGRPIDRLASHMGNLDTRTTNPIPHTSKIHEIHLLEEAYNSMIRQITSLIQLTREEEVKLAQAEKKALLAQMNPHFLYNTLNTITALAKRNRQKEIELISVKLGRLVRDAVDNTSEEATLGASFSLIESYITIQRYRFGEKLKAELFLDPSLTDTLTPKLIIQPLVENALVHGLEEKLGEWNLEVTAIRREGNIIITVQDNGAGFDTSILETFGTGSEHVGLQNIHQRLRLRYGDHVSFSVVSRPGEGTLATIQIEESAL